MDYQQILRSKSLTNIPERKLQDQIALLIQNCKICSPKNIKVSNQVFDGLCEKCSINIIAYNRYYISNIPIDYWALDMKDFKGAEELKKAYFYTIENIQKIYHMGFSMCFAGTHGIGKTFIATNILKKASQKNYSCLYTTLVDIINILLEAPHEDKFLSKKELMTVDFLVIDEMDSRFILSNNASELFGSTFEHIFRTRMQNKLPIIICTNSPNPIEAFSGSIKQSLDSLMSKVKFISTIDKDFRKTNGY